MYVGLRYRLVYCRSLLLLYHDSAVSGPRLSVGDTLARLPGRSGGRTWSTSGVCGLYGEAQRRLIFEHPSSLYDCPFQVVSVDAIGPTHPPDEGCA